MGNRTIVVFDDDITALYRVILEADHWKVICYPDCSDVLEKISKSNPRIIIMDHNIPIEGGIKTIQLIKGSRYYSIPIILLSAHYKVMLLAEEAGTEYFMEKPFDLSEFRALIKHINFQSFDKA